jgi:signal transduction histidine kinase
LNNAFDAIAELEPKWIELAVSATAERMVQISVTDCGNGIPAAIRDKIMNPFFTTKPVNKGTGLGLSISRSIMEDHGGKFYLDTECAHTRFVLELPMII